MDPFPKHNIDGRKRPTEKHMQYDSNYMKSPKQKVFFFLSNKDKQMSYLYKI